MPGALIPVKPGMIGGTACLVVDARTLHEFLGVRRDFTSWFKDRTEAYGLDDGSDFQRKLDSPDLVNQVSPSPHGGDRRSTEFDLSLNTAKELAMVERGPKGREIRRYFIQCEKELLAIKSAPKTDKILSIAELYNILRSVGRMSRIADVEAFREYARILGLVGAERESIAIEIAQAVSSKKYLEQVAFLRGQKVDATNPENVLLVLQKMQLAV